MQIVYYSILLSGPTSIKNHKPVCTEQAWLSKKKISKKTDVNLYDDQCCMWKTHLVMTVHALKDIFSFGFRPPNYYCLSIGHW